MHAKRTRFAHDIVTEFFPPKKESNKVIIFCDGMPGMPGNKKTQLYYRKKGFWTFYPRYRGTWESDGCFLDHDPTDDIQDVIDSLTEPFESLWDGEIFYIHNPEIYIIGISFGGPAALLLSSHPAVKKVVSLCGVVDWTHPGPDERLEWLFQTVQKAFGNGYRMKHMDDWKQLEHGVLYNPVAHTERIDAKKVLHIHATDDTIVPYETVRDFSDRIGSTLHTEQRGGHLSSRYLRNWWNYRIVRKHFNT